MEYQVDATGLKCPEPVMMLHAAIRKASSGDVVCLRPQIPPLSVMSRNSAISWDTNCSNIIRMGAFLYRVKKAG